MQLTRTHGVDTSQMPQQQYFIAPRTFATLIKCQKFSIESFPLVDVLVRMPWMLRFQMYKFPWFVPAHSVWLSVQYAIHVNTSTVAFGAPFDVETFNSLSSIVRDISSSSSASSSSSSSISSSSSSSPSLPALQECWLLICYFGQRLYHIERKYNYLH